MDRAYHPAWREAIIPFLDDQRQLDQLWCSSKGLHYPILTAGKQMTCWCRPMNSPIKNRGIYPSYLSEMTNLRSITVDLEPRLETTWAEYDHWQCKAVEIFSTMVPTTVKKFETYIYNIDWAGLNHQQQRDALKGWLDRFPNKGLELGAEMKRIVYRMMTDDPRSPAMDISVAATNLYWLHYQYITYVNISELRTLMLALAQHGDDELTQRFTTGVTKVLLHHDLQASRRGDLTASDDPYVGVLYQILPNLQEIFGYMPQLPAGLHKFIVSGFDSPQPQSIPILPDSLDTLIIPWYILDFGRLSFPPNLTELHLEKAWGFVQSSTITTEWFAQIIAALPSSLKVLRVGEIYLSESTLDYWPIENIVALPRMLKSLYVSPNKWKIMGDQDSTIARLQALPRHLSELSLPIVQGEENYGLEPVELLQLPPSLTYITLTVKSEHLLTFQQNILHFTQLHTLELIINVLTSDEFPTVILPANLKNLLLSIVSLGNQELSVPLHLIQWPEQMDAITIQVGIAATLGEDEVFSISQWNLPRKLSQLVLEGIAVKVLPSSWPLGLNTFTCEIGEGLSEASEISEVWPDMGRMAYYLPDSTLCYTAVSDHTYDSKTRSIRTNPQTGRPIMVITED